MTRAKDMARPGADASVDAATTAADLVKRIRLNVDRVDAGLQTWDEFTAANGALWDEVVAAGHEVDALVLAALRADLAVAR